MVVLRRCARKNCTLHPDIAGSLGISLGAHAPLFGAPYNKSPMQPLPVRSADGERATNIETYIPCSTFDVSGIIRPKGLRLD